jgi:hypothetical protein
MADCAVQCAMPAKFETSAVLATDCTMPAARTAPLRPRRACVPPFAMPHHHHSALPPGALVVFVSYGWLRPHIRHPDGAHHPTHAMVSESASCASFSSSRIWQVAESAHCATVHRLYTAQGGRAQGGARTPHHCCWCVSGVPASAPGAAHPRLKRAVARSVWCAQYRSRGECCRCVRPHRKSHVHNDAVCHGAPIS